MKFQEKKRFDRKRSIQMLKGNEMAVSKKRYRFLLFAISVGIILCFLVGNAFAADVWYNVFGKPFVSGSYGENQILTMAEFGGTIYVGTGQTTTNTYSANVYRLVSEGCKSWECFTPPWSQFTGSGSEPYTMAMFVFKNNLYVGTDQGEVWRTDGLQWKNWKNVTGPWSQDAITDMAEFDGYLYISFFGLKIWRTKDGSSWEPVVGPDTTLYPFKFTDPYSDDLYSLEVLGNHLYAGVGRKKWNNKYNHWDTAIALWRMDKNGKWGMFQKIDFYSGPFSLKLPGHVYALKTFKNHLYLGEYHGGGLYRTDGSATSWDYINAGIVGQGVYRLEEHNGKLYLGMSDFTGAPGWVGTPLLFCSTDGTQWSQVPGGPVVGPDTVSIPSLLSSKKTLYVGYWNSLSNSGTLTIDALGPAPPPSCPTTVFTTDFETGNLQGWTKTGNAFDFQPTKGDNPTARGRGQPSNHEGEWWIGTYEKYQGKPGQKAGDVQGDSPKGTLTSTPFMVIGEKINFLIGGGNYPVGNPAGATAVVLEIDGKIVREYTGKNHETMERTEWNVAKFKGELAVIKIIDDNSGGWGHINCDDFNMLDATGEELPFSTTTPLPTIQEWLQAHNKYRCIHGVPPVKWSEKLAKSAQASVNKNKGKEFAHTPGASENAAFGSFSGSEDVVNLWYNEESLYDYNNPKWDPKTGNFTQVVWKSTKEVGCAYCSGCKVKLKGTEYTGLWICQYDTGNVIGQFKQNVPKPIMTEAKCKPDAVYYCSSCNNGQGKWESGTTKCWQIDGNPDYGKDTGRDCSVCWRSSGSSPPVTACGECPGYLTGRWYNIKGGSGACVGSVGYPPGWTAEGCWHLIGYSGQKIMQCPSIAPYPLIRGVRVGGFSACWEQLDSSGKGTGIIFCDY